MNTQTIALKYCEGINVIIQDGKAAVNYEIDTLMKLTEEERQAIQQTIKANLIGKGLIEQ